MKKSFLIFDVNETLLYLTPLKQNINTALDNEQAANIWFSKLLHYSLVETVCGNYHDFSEVGIAAFKLIQGIFDKSYDEDEIQKILSSMEKLKPYPEVAEALQVLSESYMLMAFSNGKPEVLHNQLENAGILHLFEHVLSVEGCRKYKPHPEAYRFALKTAKVNAEETVMIAAHGWDIAGAAYAGMETVFVERGKKPYSLAPAPIYSVSSLAELNEILSS